jgi:hypothetical protein
LHFFLLVDLGPSHRRVALIAHRIMSAVFRWDSFTRDLDGLQQCCLCSLEQGQGTVLKYHRVKHTEYSLTVKEGDRGELKVTARDTSAYADLKDREQHVCDIPDNLMLVTVPYLSRNRRRDVYR